MKQMKRGALLAALMLLASAAAMAARTEVALDSRPAGRAECSFGNLLADALRAASQAEVGLVNASHLRPTVLPAGLVDPAQVTAALVYPSEQVVLVELEGARLAAALERAVSIVPQPNHGFLQVSGLSFTFRPKSPPGSRVQQVLVGKEPLAAGRKYRVALPETLAKGAQGYSRVFNGLVVKEKNGTIAQAISNYLASKEVLDVKPGRRIREVDGS
jgi:2',3'-cyclic-nucleotide 2'-phosphodiesterase (5'-nucleotidase family)